MKFLVSIPKKSTKELESILANRQKYVPEAVETARNELENRKRFISQEEPKTTYQEEEAPQKEKKSIYERSWMPYFLISFSIAIPVFFIATIHDEKRTPPTIFTSLGLLLTMWWSYIRAKRKVK
ncbi:hypothetical protein [Rufibacter soli]